MGVPTPLRRVLGLDALGWMMAPSERLAIVGLLAMLRPKTALELGCADGGLTSWLSTYAEAVVTVDIDEKVLRVAASLPNVTPLHMTSAEATCRLEAEGRRFDLTVVDADHSAAGVRRDLESALRFSEVIVLHDTYNPDCRAGIVEVLAGRDVYHDLDLVPGGLQPDGLWGGLGIVIPGLSVSEPRHVTPRESVFPWLAERAQRPQSVERGLWRSARRLVRGG